MISREERLRRRREYAATPAAKARKKEYNAAHEEEAAARHKLWHEANKESQAVLRKAYRDKHKEEAAVSRKKYTATPKGRAAVILASSARAAKNGGYTPISMSTAELVAYLIEHNGVCAIPGCDNHEASGAYRLHAEHDHETGEFRGLVCNQCNVAMGQTGDSPERLRALANFLENGGTNV